MKKNYLILFCLFVFAQASRAQCTYSTSQTISAATFIACGSVTINSGVTLTVTGPVSMSGGSLTITDNGTIDISGGFTNSGGAFSVTGTGSMAIAGAITLSGGSFTNSVSTTASSLTMSGGTVMDNGSLTLSGNLIMSGGSVSGTGSLTIDGTSTMSGGTVFGNSTACSDCTISASGEAYSPCGFKYNRLIRIDHTKVSGGVNLTNFSVLISTKGLSDEALFKQSPAGHVQSSGGFDIIFTDADGVTPLNFQIESYSATTGEYEAWVQIPTLSATEDTYLYMYYDNTGVTTDQSTTSTWDANHVGVWHLDSSAYSATYTKDYTSNGNTATNNKSKTNIAGGEILDARAFAGSTTTTEYVHLGLTNASANYGTITLWGKITTYGNSTYFFGHSSTQTGATYTDRIQLYQNSTTGQLELGLGQTHTLFADPTNITLNSWNHIALTWSVTNAVTGDGNYALYVNGALLSASTYSTLTTLASFGDIGNDGNASQETEALTGSIDEVHISKIARTAGWITTEYNNQNSPSTFAIIATEPNTWLGTTSTSWSGAGTNWSSGSVPTSGANVIIAKSGSNQPIVDANEQVGYIWVQSGATLTIKAGNSLSVHDNVMNCGTLTSAATGTLIMNSNSTTTPQNQNISGSTGTYSLGCLTINNTFATSPSVTLNAPVTVSGTLALTSGLFNTDATNILIMQNGSIAPALTSASTSYVNGPMEYQLTSVATTTLNFPVGASPDCRPCALTLQHKTHATYNYTAQMFDGNPWTAMGSTLSSQMPSTVDTISGVHYWTINRTDSSGATQSSANLNGNQTIQLYFGTNDQVFQGSNLTIVKNTSATPASWIDIGGSTTLGSFTTAQTGSISSTSSPSAFSSFSTFSLGSDYTGKNPLPIKLLDFTAVPDGEKVDVAWQTVIEVNNAYFTVEKSKDGTNFTKVIDVLGAGNSTTHRDYAEIDYQPYIGTSYYRLKQTDKNGAFTYSSIVAVNFNAHQNITLYPNPIDNKTSLNVNVFGFQNQEVVVVLRDAQGRMFLSKVLLSAETNQVFIIDEMQSLSPGIYIVSASSNDKIYNSKLIVK